MEVLKKVDSVIAVLAAENIDTDQIIPAEHLKITNKTGLGNHLFANWRYDESGHPVEDFVLNRFPTNKAKVLVGGDNFGCGSSREHAPWALTDFGIQVVISTSIADIFRNNAIKNGLLPIVVEREIHQKLLTYNAKPISVDIKKQKILVENNSFDFGLEPFTRYCFLNGLDQLDFIFKHEAQITAFESQQESFV